MKNSISFLIASICKKHRSLAHELLYEKAGLHVGQEMILNILWETDGISQTQLASKLDIKQATIAKSLKRMEEKNLVNREKDSVDSRISRVFLTKKGKEIKIIVNDTWIHLEDKTLIGLTENELISLKNLLVKVKMNLNQ